MFRCLLFSILCGTVLGAAPTEYVPYAPPFAPTTEQRSDTRVNVGKYSVTFQGARLALRLFTTGEANLLSPDLKIRYGGLVVRQGKKSLSGRRGELHNGSCAFRYTALPHLEQNFTLLPDGRISIKLTDSNRSLDDIFWTFSLISEYFGGSAIEIDGRRAQIAPYRESSRFHRVLHDGTAGRIVFFAGDSGRSFTIELPQKNRIRLVSADGRYGLSLQLFPASQANTIEMLLTPGTTAVAANQPPKGFSVRAGQYDFWSVDRLRLPDRHSKNLLSNSSFEQGFASLWYPHGGGLFSRKLWTRKPIRIDEEEAFSGKSSLRIESDAPQAELIQNIATHSVILSPGEYTFSFYAKTDRPGRQKLKLTIPVLPPGANYWDPKTRVNRRFTLEGRWKRYQHTFRVTTTRPQYFLFESLSDEPAVCRIDAMQLERNSAATEYQPASVEGRLLTASADNFLPAGSPIKARLKIITARPNISGTFHTTLRDFFGKVVRQATGRFQTGPDGTTELPLPFEGIPSGIFTVENRYKLKDDERYEFTRLAVMNFLKNLHRHKNLFADSYIDPHGVRQYYPEVLERYREIGIGARAAFVNTEKLVADEAAKYGVESFSTMLLRPDRSLVKGLPAPCYGYTVLNNIVWYETPSVGRKRVDYATITLPGATPEALKTIENAAARKSAESPWVKIWGAINEVEGSAPEFGHCRFATEERYREYVELELAVARGLRRGNPKAMIGNSSTSCLRADRIETLDKLLTTIGDRFRYDCFIIHTYREAPEYPDLDKDFYDLYKMLARHGYIDTPIYCPEGMHWKPYRMPGLFTVNWVDIPWGPLTYDMGHQERIAAAWRARQWLIGLKHQDRVKLMNSSTNFWGFEMDCALTPFANQKISNTLGNLLGDASFVAEIRLGAGTRCYLFKDGSQRPVAALWSCSPEVDQGKEAGPELLLRQVPHAQLFDLMEAELAFPAPAADGSVNLRLTSFPIFLRGSAGSTATMKKLLENADLLRDNTPAVSTRFEVPSPEQFTLTLANEGKRKFTGQIEIGGMRRQLTLPPGGNLSLHAPMPAVLTAGRLCFERLRAELQQNTPFPGNFPLQLEFCGVLARKAAIRIDGSLDDWRGIPSLKIDQRLPGQQLLAAGTPPVEGDFAAKMRIAWSSKALYLAVEVTDDKFVANPQARPGNGWRNDSLQLFFDTLGDGHDPRHSGIGRDDWSYGIYPEPDGKAWYAYRHHVPDIQLTAGFSGAKAETKAEEIQCAFTRTSRGYIYEIALPQHSLMPLQLAAGQKFGLGVLLNDQDSNTPMPRSRLVWGLQPIMPNDRPDLWPLVILTDK